MPYCTSKTALDRLTKGFAVELAEFGIRVNALEPGFAAGSTVSELTDEHIGNTIAQIPLGRPSSREDVGNGLLYLASDASSYVTGSTLTVDGGNSIGSLAVHQAKKNAALGGPAHDRSRRSPDFPPAYEWPAGKVAARFCFTVDVDAESPICGAWRRDAAGDARARWSSALFGPRTGSWRLLDLLDRYGIKGTFFVPGSSPGIIPTCCRRSSARGHEVGLHGYFHEHRVRRGTTSSPARSKSPLPCSRTRSASCRRAFAHRHGR